MLSLSKLVASTSKLVACGTLAAASLLVPEWCAAQEQVSIQAALERLSLAQRSFANAEYAEALRLARSLSPYELVASDPDERELLTKTTSLLIADSLFALDDVQGAKEEMANLIRLSDEGVVSPATAAEAQLRIATMLRDSGDFSGAAHWFFIVAEREDLEPFADFARRALDDLEARRTTTVSGVVVATNETVLENVTAFVFNGESWAASFAHTDGTFAVPVHDAIPGTFAVVVISAPGHWPTVSTSDIGADRTLDIGALTLEPYDGDPTHGILVGIPVTTLEGVQGPGRVGIQSVVLEYVLKASGPESVRCPVDPELYACRISLPPGEYELESQHIGEPHSFTIRASEATHLGIKVGVTRTR